MRIVARVLMLFASTALAACATTDRNVKLAPRDFSQEHGYRGKPLEKQALKDTLFILTFSGGGTRAAALSQGVLRELEATTIAGGRRLLDEVDIVSSVSGGSVTAANFVANGRDSFDDFEQNFVRHDFMPELIDAFINPINIIRYSLTSESRIDRLVDIFEERVFSGDVKTFGQLAAIKEDRPFLMLNAADMTSTLRFTFTQSRFDLLCSDIDPFPIAQAVAASAAYPVGLTPLTLTNHSPCDGGSEMVSRVDSHVGDNIYQTSDGEDGITRTPGDMIYVPKNIPGEKLKDAGAAMETRYWGLRQQRLLNRAPPDWPDAEDVDAASDDKYRVPQKYLHLLDGGIADNLGLHAVLTDLWAVGEDGSTFTDPRYDPLKRVVFLVVNARSDQDFERDLSGSPPGIVDMILTSVGSSIDNRSESLIATIQASMDSVFKNAGGKGPKTEVIFVDFDLIRQDTCRNTFAHTKTNWGLKNAQVDALMLMGSAMVRASPAFGRLVKDAGGVVAGGERAGSKVWPGQARAKEACRRMRDPDDDKPYVLNFGNTE